MYVCMPYFVVDVYLRLLADIPCICNCVHTLIHISHHLCKPVLKHFVQVYNKSTSLLLSWIHRIPFLKAGPLRLKQLTNTLKIRILSETSILYLIRYASIILTVGLRL